MKLIPLLCALCAFVWIGCPSSVDTTQLDCSKFPGTWVNSGIRTNGTDTIVISGNSTQVTINKMPTVVLRSSCSDKILSGIYVGDSTKDGVVYYSKTLSLTEVNTAYAVDTIQTSFSGIRSKDVKSYPIVKIK